MKKLREKHKPFVNLTRQMADVQARNGDMFLIEQPLHSRARKEKEILELEDKEVERATGKLTDVLERSRKL